MIERGPFFIKRPIYVESDIIFILNNSSDTRLEFWKYPKK